MNCRPNTSCKELVSRVSEAVYDHMERANENSKEGLLTRISQLEKFCEKQCGDSGDG